MKSILESLLFISDRPLAKKELAKLINQKVSNVETALQELIDEYNLRDGGIKIIQNGNEYQMVTSPKNTEIVQNFLKEEISGELTPASLETLSIIAYRGPTPREEIEQIRGVNCTIILRHLMIKGLIVGEEEDGRMLYRLSLDFIRHLGVADLKELPDYEKLRSIETQPALINADQDLPAQTGADQRG